MPTIGGITAWLSVGETRLPEHGIEIDDDVVKCYIEVPATPPVEPSTLPITPRSPSLGGPSGPNMTPPPGPLEYAINWKIQDLTYTMVAVADIDGALQIEKIHLGRGTITAAKNTSRIDAVPVTDDWSKRRLLTFVKLQALLTAPHVKAVENAALPKEQLGTIRISFYRAGKASMSSGLKSSATGFHRPTMPNPKSLVKETSVDGLYSKSHSTGLGAVTFGQPKKVWTTGARDKQPYVTFEFLYRSRELITEALPDEGWELTAPPPSANFNKDLPMLQEPKSSLRRTNTGSLPPVAGGGAKLFKRPSITVKKWAADIKTASSARLVRGRMSDGGSRVEVISTPMDAIKNPFVPRSQELPRTPAAEDSEGIDIERSHSIAGGAVVDAEKTEAKLPEDEKA